MCDVDVLFLLSSRLITDRCLYAPSHSLAYHTEPISPAMKRISRNPLSIIKNGPRNKRVSYFRRAISPSLYAHRTVNSLRHYCISPSSSRRIKEILLYESAKETFTLRILNLPAQNQPTILGETEIIEKSACKKKKEIKI